MNLLGTILFASGAMLIYGAVKDKTPAQIFRELRTGSGTQTGIGIGASGSGFDMAPPGNIRRTGN